MRDINRIDVFLERIGKIWKEEFPDWRFTQLICNLQSYAGSDMFYCEEDKFLKILDNYIGDMNE